MTGPASAKAALRGVTVVAMPSSAKRKGALSSAARASGPDVWTRRHPLVRVSEMKRGVRHQLTENERRDVRRALDSEDAGSGTNMFPVMMGMGTATPDRMREFRDRYTPKPPPAGPVPRVVGRDMHMMM